MDKPQLTRVMIVDDNASVRAGLKTVFEVFEDIEVVAEASNGASAIELCARNRLDVILMDLIMPDMDGIRTTQAIHQNFPEILVLILTGWQDRLSPEAARQAGAVGLLHKDVSAEILVSAVRVIRAGLTVGAQPKPGFADDTAH
jgi:NarL family two-component system response regulator LiaR